LEEGKRKKKNLRQTNTLKDNRQILKAQTAKRRTTSIEKEGRGRLQIYAFRKTAHLFKRKGDKKALQKKK